MSQDEPKTSRLVRSVYKSLEREIRIGRFSNRLILPAEKTLASDFGTSRSTIRQVVDLLARDGIVVKRPHSSPAIVQLKDNRLQAASHDVLIWVSHPLSDVSTLSFLKGVSRGLWGANYRMSVREPRRNVGDVVCSDEKQFVEELLANDDWAGAILWRDAFAHHDDLLNLLSAKQQPLIFVDIPPPAGSRGDYVGTSNASAAQACTDHLLSLGHSRIAFIADTDIPKTTQERIRGYRRAMSHAGLADRTHVVIADALPGYPDEVVLPTSPTAKPNRYFSDLAGRVARWVLNADPRPTALFVAHDVFARQLMTHLEAIGIKVPFDLSVVGFDWLAGIDPSLPDDLTSASQSFEEIGFQAACLFLDRASHELASAPQQILINAPIVIRPSTAPGFRPHAGD